ncbi:MAG: DJ-1/PfpI family protein [Candidatus Sericytochromatia bacterium]
MVLASHDFRDEEYSITERVLTQKDIMVLTSSTTIDNIKGMLGTVIKPDIHLDSIQEFSFDGIVIIGGNGAKELWDNKKLISLVKEFNNNKKPIGAICLAPMVLANAGILRNKRATIHESAVREFKTKKLLYSNNNIEISDNIITANSPSASTIFAQTFVNALLKI